LDRDVEGAGSDVLKKKGGNVEAVDFGKPL